MRPLLTLALLAITSAAAVQATAAGDQVVSRDGIEVTLLPTMAQARGNGAVIEITLDIEARTDAAAQRLGFHSLRAVTDVDCAKGANQFVKAEEFDQPDLVGQGRSRLVSGAWVTATPDSYMFAVTQRVCAAGAAPAPGPAITVTEAAAPPPPAPTAPPPAVTVPAPTPPVTPPVTVSMTPRPAPPPLAAPPQAPAPRPTPKTGMVLVMRFAGPAIAQVTASPTPQGAQHALAELKSLIAAPLAGSVEAATVDGAKVYRASVAGFATSADARAFCARAAGFTKTCWVRPLEPPPSAKPRRA